VAIESGLREAFSRVTTEAPRPLAEAMGYSLFAPGKRLRPLLTVLACEAVGGTMSVALPAASAVEMIHTYSLIHDDLPAMDDDDLRRGQPACHKVYGEALAILAGDALLTAAFEVLAGGYSSQVAAVCCLELARASGSTGMVAGQVLDLAAEERIALSYEPNLAFLRQIHRRKTGALIRVALRLGVYVGMGDLSESTAAAVERMDCFGEAFGLAFQVTDDLLDVESTTERTGKRVGKDAVRGKLTYPGLLGIAASREHARELVAEAIGAVQGFGTAGETLVELAKAVIDRDR
jgi:geranylgeranyl diphosphate synthase type II